MKEISLGEIFLKGTIMAAIITIPSLAAFMVSWNLLDDIIQAGIIGIVIHIVIMIFAFRIAKRLFP